MSQLVDGNAYLYCSPDKSGGTFYAYAGWISDARFKTNIRDSEINGLDAVMAIRMRAFDWTPEARARYPWHDEKPEIGFVAQEVQQIIPNAVKSLEHPGEPMVIEAWTLIPYMFRAIQQLAEQNAALENRLAALEAR